MNRLLIVVTSGELQWDERAGDFDWERSTALPPALRAAFNDQPLWVDTRWSQSSDQVSRVNPRLQEAIADIASAIRGVAKDALVGTAVREHKRTMRLARGAQIGLATLFVASVVAAVIAVGQRNNAVDQANIALARQLAATSTSQLSTNLDVAQLLAVKAHRTDPNPQTRSALLQAVTSSPHLVRYLPMGGQVTELDGSENGQTVVAGLADGRVLRWNLAEPTPQTMIALPAAVSSLAVNRDGTVLIASDGSDAVLCDLACR